MSIGLEAWQWGVGVSEFLLFYLPCELWVRKREKDRAIGSLRKENTALAAAESTLAALESHQIAMERAKQQIEMLSKQRMELQHKMERLEDQKPKPPKGAIDFSRYQVPAYYAIPGPMIGHVPTNYCDQCGVKTDPRHDESLCRTCQHKYTAMLRVKHRKMASSWGMIP